MLNYSFGLRMLSGFKQKCANRFFKCHMHMSFMKSNTKPLSVNALETSLSPVNDPLASEDYFALRNLVSLSSLFAARAHLGHKSILRNPYMVPYLFGDRQGIDIIDLEQTHKLLHDACNIIAHIAYRGGIILFLMHNQQMVPLVERTAWRIGEFSFCREWRADAFTNAAMFYKDSDQVRLPDLLICLDTPPPTAGIDSEYDSPICAAAKLLIPTVAVVDTNTDPRLVSFPVPGNDDSPVTVRLWCAAFASAVQAGKQRALIDAGLSSHDGLINEDSFNEADPSSLAAIELGGAGMNTMRTNRQQSLNDWVDEDLGWETDTR